MVVILICKVTTQATPPQIGWWCWRSWDTVEEVVHGSRSSRWDCRGSHFVSTMWYPFWEVFLKKLLEEIYFGGIFLKNSNYSFIYAVNKGETLNMVCIYVVKWCIYYCLKQIQCSLVFVFPRGDDDDVGELSILERRGLRIVNGLRGRVWEEDYTIDRTD